MVWVGSPKHPKTRVVWASYPRNRTLSNSAQDIAEYWQNNGDLAAELQEYWGHSAPASMDKVFPVRFYGDGADTTGLNSFELLTMISVSPKHSSTMKTRFVFLDDLLAILYAGFAV